MKCIIVCCYRPEDGHTDDRNMLSVDKRHPVLRCNYKYSCVDGYNKQVNNNTTVWKELKKKKVNKLL
jgi:hypothetical protein